MAKSSASPRKPNRRTVNLGVVDEVKFRPRDPLLFDTYTCVRCEAVCEFLKPAIKCSCDRKPIEVEKPAKRGFPFGGGFHKYRAKPVVVNGIRFDSKGEGHRYSQLMYRAEVLQNISTPMLQPKFEFCHDGIPFLKYEADFAYTEGCKEIIEDFKGMELPIWKLKKKLFRMFYPHLVLRVVKR